MNGRIYIIGGLIKQKQFFTSTVQCYDPVRDRWTKISAIPSPRYNVKTCIWNGKLLISGGCCTKDDLIKKVYCYAPKENVWEEEESLLNESKYLFTASSNFF